MPKTGPKRDLDAERRIIDATCDLIRERGPGQVGINDIAKAANVGKQTIYRWWPSKTAVVIEALERQFESESPFPETGSAYDAITIQMNRVATTFGSSTGSIICEMVSQIQSDDAIAAQFRDRFFSQRRARGAKALRSGMETGELRDDLDIEVVIDLLYSPLWMRMLIGHQPLTQASRRARVATPSARRLTPTRPTRAKSSTRPSKPKSDRDRVTAVSPVARAGLTGPSHVPIRCSVVD